MESWATLIADTMACWVIDQSCIGLKGKSGKVITKKSIADRYRKFVIEFANNASPDELDRLAIAITNSPVDYEPLNANLWGNHHD